MSTDAVTTIIEALNEHDEQPRKQIAEIVEVLGADASLALLAETKQVQGSGGIEVRDGTRRRTDGGVFFSLAKSKLPKADRNRIFRVKPPKPPGEEESSNGAPPKAAPPPPAPAAPPRREEPRRQEQLNLPQHRQVVASQKAAEQGGRRRVVEVEVLRHAPKPAPLPPPESVRSAPSNVRPEPQPPPAPARPVRKIITVAAPPKAEPLPSTPEAALERVRALLRDLGKGDQRKVLLELLEGVGGLPKPEPRREPRPAPPPPAPPPQARLDASGKERVLAAVTEALNLTAGDLARVLYGDDSAGPKAKARSVLERYRRSRG